MSNIGKPGTGHENRINPSQPAHVMESAEPSTSSATDLAAQIQRLHRRAVLEYTPLVEDIIRSDNRDVPHIERTLDGLLDFCSDDAILVLYRRLCSYYWPIDPAATARYVQFYRQMWDAKPEIEDSASAMQ